MIPQEREDHVAEGFGPMSEWPVGPDVDLEVFSGEDYRKHSKPGDHRG